MQTTNETSRTVEEITKEIKSVRQTLRYREENKPWGFTVDPEHKTAHSFKWSTNAGSLVFSTSVIIDWMENGGHQSQNFAVNWVAQGGVADEVRSADAEVFLQDTSEGREMLRLHAYSNGPGTGFANSVSGRIYYWGKEDQGMAFWDNTGRCRYAHKYTRKSIGSAIVAATKDLGEVFRCFVIDQHSKRTSEHIQRLNHLEQELKDAKEKNEEDARNLSIQSGEIVSVAVQHLGEEKTLGRHVAAYDLTRGEARALMARLAAALDEGVKVYTCVNCGQKHNSSTCPNGCI